MITISCWPNFQSTTLLVSVWSPRFNMLKLLLRRHSSLFESVPGFVNSIYIYQCDHKVTCSNYGYWPTVILQEKYFVSINYEIEFVLPCLAATNSKIGTCIFCQNYIGKDLLLILVVSYYIPYFANILLKPDHCNTKRYSYISFLPEKAPLMISSVVFD